MDTLSKTYHVLVAEDVKLNFILVRNVLEKHIACNFVIHHAENGKEAVDICKENSEINLVIMDIRMPIMDGYEATEIIKKHRKNLPVIAHTAFCTKRDITTALQAGCDIVLKKPLDRVAFKKTVESYLKVGVN